MDNENIFKKVPSNRPDNKLDEDTAKKIPVIQVSFAYNIFVPNDDSDPTILYTNVTIEGYIDDKGNIEFPKNEVIWEQLDKALILKHRFKKLNLLKSSYRILCNDGNMGPSHDFSNQICCHNNENSYYLVNINQFVNNRVNGTFMHPDYGANGEILVTYQIIDCRYGITSGYLHNGTVTIRSNKLSKRGIMNALATDLIDDDFRDGFICKHAEFRTVIDDGAISGVVRYSGSHSISFNDSCCSSDMKYYPNEDDVLVDLGYNSITEFFELYNKEGKWYQMI